MQVGSRDSAASVWRFPNFSMTYSTWGVWYSAISEATRASE